MPANFGTLAQGKGCNRWTMTPEEFLCLTRGFVSVIPASGPWQPWLYHIARPGWWVGEAAAVTVTNRRAEIHACSDISFLFLSLSALEKIAAQDPMCWRVISQITVSHMDNALSLVSTVMQDDVRTRIVGTLIRLAGPLMHLDEETFIPCSQQELGELSGLSRNSVGAALKSLEQDSLISRRSYGKIRYNPVHLLRHLES